MQRALQSLRHAQKVDWPTSQVLFGIGEKKAQKAVSKASDVAGDVANKAGDVANKADVGNVADKAGDVAKKVCFQPVMCTQWPLMMC